MKCRIWKTGEECWTEEEYEIKEVCSLQELKECIEDLGYFAIIHYSPLSTDYELDIFPYEED